MKVDVSGCRLEAVINVCRKSRSLADAGRALFGASRTRREPSTIPIGCENSSGDLA
jgi:sigma54-dependent transcription regulator